MTEIAAIVLAGGKSSRMGQDKALIKLGDRSLLYQICTLAQECATQVYVVTPWVEKYQAILPPNCQIIPEIIRHQGPLTGFAVGLTHVKQEWVLLLACDLPLLKTSVVKQWCQYLPTVPSSAIALLPSSSKGWDPLCGFYRRSCLSSLKIYLEGGGRSFQSWLSNHIVQELPIRDRQILFNCNTLEDLKQIPNFSENSDQILPSNH